MRILINLCSVAIIVQLLAGCGSPEPQGAEKLWLEEKDAAVRENMRRVQIAAEHYAADHGGGNYPRLIDDSFKTYFPGGLDAVTPAPVGPVNPFTGKNEFPGMGAVKDVHAVRFGKRFSIVPGSIEYSALLSGDGYAIIGGAHDGKVLMDYNNQDQVLVFSNE